MRAGIYSKNIEVCGASFACDRAKMACDSGKGAFVSNFTYFEKSMLVEAEKRQYIVENIDRAIAEKWIKVYYQPIIRAANGKVCDEEALARWIDPQKGFLSPVDFIPILEDSGLIYKLDLFMLEGILKKLEEQKKAGLYLAPISVNLSRSDFDSCDIVQEIYQRVQKSSIPLDKITIEMTESILGGDFDYMKSQIKRFKDLGFKVWLDDFGSGYSSLEVLHDVPFDLIKFDMKFMREFKRSEKSKIMLSGLLKIATELGLET
ncbi:MAG: EAL domain-containing protein, partial [Treponema sp.]|nr:EAL domain-containing protein [Treponema sp.]